ncbi:RNA polymerase sigma factor [Streptomyces mexicanus]|jgi:RNA polymerase sigma-70 factor (ECF subfamily)|uniref:RNA polymerase sigma factor n=1 Tax=Streptomyces mexicanus TaxID=178566 RepID=UPI0036C6730A
MSEDSDAHTLPTSFEELNALYGIHYEMPTSLDGFYRRYARAQVRYAATILGSKDAAKTVVRSLYTHLALNWSAILLQEGGPEAYAWRALKLRVETHARMTIAPTADGRSRTASTNDRTTAVYEAVRATLSDMRTQMADLDSPIGLYTAIAALPERQFDVIILLFALGYTVKQVAEIMGIHEGTERTHRRVARQSIAAKLGIDLGDDEEKE